jgi:hypothetical protein
VNDKWKKANAGTQKWGGFGKNIEKTLKIQYLSLFISLIFRDPVRGVPLDF